jgi:hypothetical protein
MKTKRNRGDGKYNLPVELNKGPGDNPEAKGVSVAKQIYDQRDSAGFRGGRLDRKDRTGTE